MPSFIQCPDCDPLRRDVRHRNERLARGISGLFTGAIPLNIFSSTLAKALAGREESLIFRTACALGILTEREILPEHEPQIFNRTLVLMREARARNIPFRVFACRGRCSKFFSMTIDDTKIIFDELPTLPLDLDDTPLAHKFHFKERMLAGRFPVPPGLVCRTEKEVHAALENIGFPVVVKPVFGSLSKHTRCNLSSRAEAIAAFRSARLFGDDVLVERYTPGDHYRVTILDGRVVGCCLREAPNVVGDGVHSISALVAIKNADPRRGHPTWKNYTIHTIVPTERTDNTLNAQGYTWDSVLPQGVKLYLHTKTILSGGADIHDCTDRIHPRTRELFERIAQVFDFPLIGFDVIAADIGRAWDQQTFAILEGNTKPAIDIHHYPISGAVQNIAAAVMDFITQKYRAYTPHTV